MKTILWNPQLSCISKDTHEFLLENDSNFNFFTNIVNGCNKYLPNKYKFLILIPHGSKYVHAENVSFIMTNFNKRVFSSRYDWDSEKYSNMIIEFQPDIIFENNPTLVNNWKTLLLEEKLIDKIKVVAYNHWIDTYEYSKIDARCPYFIRQLEGLLLSDAYLCNSKFAILQIKEQFIKTFPLMLRNKDESCFDKLFAVQPIINEENLFNSGYNRDIKILYNHRISTMRYYDDAFKKFLNILIELEQFLENKIEVIFTDVSGKLSSRNDIPLKDTKHIKIILKNNLSREEYNKVLKECNMSVSTFSNNGGCWSMSIAESILSNYIVILPNHSGYKEMVPDNYSGLCEDIQSYVKKICYYVNHPYDCTIENVKNFYLSNYSSEIVINKLDKILTNLSDI